MTPEVNEALRALHARGREAWPEIELSIAAFAAVAARRLSEGPVDEIRADDLYLAIACAAGLERAIAAFDRRYLSVITSALVRRGQAPAAAADIVQIVRMRFLVGEAGHPPRIADYDGRSSLATWIRIAAVRTAISSHRKHARETADEVDLAATDPSPELQLLRRQLGDEFGVAFRSAFESLSPRERTLLRYQVIDRLGIDRIAVIYGVHRATAARWVAHARGALVDGVRRALQDRLQLSTAELDSVLRLLHSQLEISLRMLATPSPMPTA